MGSDVRRRLVALLGLAAVVVVVVGGTVAVAHHVSQDDRRPHGNLGPPLAPTYLPVGLTLRSATPGTNTGVESTALLYATPAPSGAFTSPALLITVGFDRGPGPSIPLSDRTIQRHDLYPGSTGVSVIGSRGALELAGWGLNDLTMTAIASRIGLAVAGAPRVATDLLPPGMRLVGAPSLGLIEPVDAATTSVYQERYEGPAAPGSGVRDVLVSGSYQPAVDSTLLRIYGERSGCGPACPAGPQVQQVAIGSASGWILPVPEPGPDALARVAVRSVFWVESGQGLRIDASGISEAEMLRIARSVRLVGPSAPAALREIVPRGDDTNIPRPSVDEVLGPLPSGRVIVAEGGDDGGPWRVTRRRADRGGEPLVCWETTTDGGCSDADQNFAVGRRQQVLLFSPDLAAPAQPALYVGLAGSDLVKVRGRLSIDAQVTVPGQIVAVRTPGTNYRLWILAAPQGTPPSDVELVRKDGSVLHPTG